MRSSWGCRCVRSLMILVSWVAKLTSLGSSLRITPFLMSRFSSLGRFLRGSGESPSLPASSCASLSSRCTMLRQVSGVLPARIDYKQLMEGQTAQSKTTNQQRLKELARKQIDLQDNMEHYANSLVQRINEPSSKGNKQLNKKINNQIESNVCSICLELMLPPVHNPILLFPCGHNVCKDCLFEHPPQGPLKKNLRLKFDKCSLCRQKIDSYALNQSLMTLICTYSNNRHLIEQEQQRIERQPQEGQSFNQLKARCTILQEELQGLNAEREEYSRSQAVLAEVIQTLKHEKKKVERQIEKTHEEGRLIDRFLSQKVQEMQFLENSLQEAQQRSSVLEKAIYPLQQEKERKELMLISRIIHKD